MKTERFEMRLDSKTLERLDAWRSKQYGIPSRAEAVRRLMESELGERRFRISGSEKLILSALRDLNRRLDGKESEIDLDFVLDALLGGHLWAVRRRYSGLLGVDDDDERVVSEVHKILEMWWLLERGYDQLGTDDKARIASALEPLGGDVRFPGFDGNKEFEYLNITKFLIERMDHFQSFKGRELNSHQPVLEGYRRMMPVFELKQIHLANRDLWVDEIISILKARVPRSGA